MIDLHCDTISALYKQNQVDLGFNHYQVDLNKLQLGGYNLQTFAIFTYLKQPNFYQETLKMLAYFQKMLHKYELNLVRNYADYQPNSLNVLLSIEDLGIIENDLARLEFLLNSGVKMTSLTWNFPNSLAYPNKIDGKNHLIMPDNDHGLTPFGLQVLKILEARKVIIDVSHLSDKGFWDIYNNTTKPFIASHSNVRALCNHPRNLTDEMIKAIASRNGVIGINFCTAFVNENSEITLIDDLIKHMDYIKNLVGVDYLALGTDFDGISPTTEIKDASEMPKLKIALANHGYQSFEIEKICKRNFLRVMKEVFND